MLHITVCIGSSCHLKGSREVVAQLQSLIAAHELQEEIDLSGTFCMGNCQNGVCVTVEDTPYSLTPENTQAFFTNTVLPALER